MTAHPGGLTQCRVCSRSKIGSDLVCSRISAHSCLLGTTLTSGHLAFSFSKWECVETLPRVNVVGRTQSTSGKYPVSHVEPAIPVEAGISILKNK